MPYSVTLDKEYDAALLALSTESGYAADDLAQSFVMSGLQGRVEAQRTKDTATLLSVFDKAQPTDTKADVLMVYESEKGK